MFQPLPSLRTIFPMFFGTLCAALPAHATTAFLQGEALYLARVVPPPDAVLVITLEDVSRADSRAREIASVRMRLSSAPPYAWQIGYDPAALEGSPRPASERRA